MATRKEAIELIRTIKPEVIKSQSEEKKSWDIYGKLVSFDINGVKRTIRVYEGKKGGACYFDIHGGGFAWGSIEDGNFYCNELANKLSLNVFSLDYPLSPENVYPSQIEYLEETIQYLIEHCDEYGFDPKSLYIGGRSAGANLAAAICLRNVKSGDNRYKVQVLDHPWLDLAGVIPKEERYVWETMPFFIDTLGTLRDVYVDEDNKSNFDVSPVVADKALLAKLPSTIIQTAECDCLRNDGDLYADILKDAGVNVTHRTALGAIHGFTEAQEEISEDGRNWLIQSLMQNM